MPTPDFEVLQEDIAQAEQRLDEVEKIYGRQSAEYQQALTRFSRLWYLFKMTRRPDEFLPEQAKHKAV
ncbi:MAG: hypothetical protein VKJ04_05020 [Vampirovibrionales bacterium]|nr:hypothetical protein [Vampirovibrionales bacterium]